MVDYADRNETSTETLSKIRSQLQGIPGNEIQVEKQEMGPPTGAPVNIEISGEDFAVIGLIGRVIEHSDGGAFQDHRGVRQQRLLEFRGDRDEVEQGVGAAIVVP